MSVLPARHAQQLFKMSLDLLIVVDASGQIASVNPSWQRVLGHEAEEMIGRHVFEFMHPEDVTRTRAEIGDISEGMPSPSFENRYRHADGHYVWLRWTSARDEAEGMIYGAARDITAERRTMEDAQAAVRRMEDAQRVAHVGSWEWNLRTGERHYTREMFAIQGMDPVFDEPWGMEELLARVTPEHHNRVREAAARMYASPDTPSELEYRMIAPHERWIRTVMEAVTGDDGEIHLLRGTTQDVTELRENERRLAEAERVAGIGSYETRLSDGRLIWSPGTYRLYGMDPEGAPVDRDAFYGLMLPDESERAQAAILHTAETGEPFEIDFSIPRGDHRIDVVGRGELFIAGDERYIRGTIQDVTQQRSVMRQQQEIARLGQMALAGTDLRQLFDEVCKVTTEVLGTDMADILALQGDGSLAFASVHGLWGEKPTGTAIEANETSAAREALDHGRGIVIPDWQAESRYRYHGVLRELGIRCTVTIPIRGRDGPFGVLTTHALKPGIDAPQLNLAFMDALASFLATAIERLRHEAEIAALATLRGRLVAENLDAEERVRQRISEQLHDGALQDLLAARQDLVEAAGSRDAGTREEMLRYAREGVERAVKLLREAVHALHPVVLQHGGLEAAMQAAADQAARQGSFRAEVTVDPAAAGLRDELVLSLARELLNNAAKHAEADVVRVTVGRQDGSVLLEVADDGRGLDPDAIAAAPMNGHIGLASMTQRVEAVGGSLDLGPTGGGGTTVLARLPID